MHKSKKRKSRFKPRPVLQTREIVKLLIAPLCLGCFLLLNQIFLIHVQFHKPEAATDGGDSEFVMDGRPGPFKPSMVAKKFVQGGVERTWTVNEYFDRVFVLNVGWNPQRWFATKARLAQFNITAERINARDWTNDEFVNGYSRFLNDAPMTDHEKQTGSRTFTNVVSWTHQFSAADVIKLAKTRGYSNFLLLDDNVWLHKNFNELFHEYATSLPHLWKVLYLGAVQHSWNVPDDLSYDGTDRSYYHPFKTEGSFAIAFDESVYDSLLWEIEKNAGPFDRFPVRRVVQAYDHQSYVLLPNLIISDLERSDSYQMSSDAAVNHAQLRWDVSQYYTHSAPERSSTTPKVSVIMTAHNARETVFLAIKSVQQQSYQHLEIIVVDDCSSDGTADIVSSMVAADSRIKLIKNKVNLGTYPSRNIALSHATGEIIAFQDADDVALKKRIEIQLAPILDGKVLFTVAHVIRSHVPKSKFEQYYNRNSIDYVEMGKEVQSKRTHRSHDGSYRYCCKEILGLMTSMFHRSVFDEIGWFDSVKFSGDSEYVERLLAYYTGILMKGKESVHGYLWRTPSVLHTYQRIDEVVLYSIKLNETLSTKVGIFSEARERYRKTYQRKLAESIERRDPQYFWLNHGNADSLTDR